MRIYLLARRLPLPKTCFDRWRGVAAFAKRFVLAGLAVLASESFACAAPLTPTMDWNGFYVGGNGGYAWGDRSVDFVGSDPNGALSFFTIAGAQPPATSFGSSGAVGGLQIGYNWQFTPNWLVGIEADFDWANIGGDVTNNNPVGTTIFAQSVDEHVKWFGTVRARLGLLQSEKLLAFISGGFAYGRVQHSGSYANQGPALVAVPGIICPQGNTCFSGSSSGTEIGWTVGGGIEYAVWRNVTLKAEYLYVDLGAESFSEQPLQYAAGAGGPASIEVNYGRTTFNVVRAGLNFRF